VSGGPRPVFPLVLSAPSGAGKTTLAQRLRASRGDVAFSVSATTRPPRGYETDGVHYHFVAPDEFRRMIGAGELAEWAEVHGRYYGTPLRNLREAERGGRFLLLDIDIQGADQVRAAVPEARLVFVLPPSGDVLVQRLTGRGSESEAEIRQRLRNARDEVLAAPRFDHVVVNDDLDAAVADLERILDGRPHEIRPAPPLERTLAEMVAAIDRYLDGSLPSHIPLQHGEVP
jgi:guanylate kinase